MALWLTVLIKTPHEIGPFIVIRPVGLANDACEACSRFRSTTCCTDADLPVVIASTLTPI